MKTKNVGKTLKRESQSRVKHGLTKKRSIPEPKRDKSEHLYFIERLCFESVV
jgi:hypothetical protein